MNPSRGARTSSFQPGNFADFLQELCPLNINRGESGRPKAKPSDHSGLSHSAP